MRKIVVVSAAAILVAASSLIGPAGAQQIKTPDVEMQHGHIPNHGVTGRPDTPTLPGQDAFGAIQEIVRILESDPTTDWSKVDLERLRQHLIDMDDVTLRSEVKSTVVSDGLSMEITGAGRTGQAIRRMVGPHAAELDKMPEWLAKTEEIPGGIRLIVTAKRPGDAKTVARIRGLAFIGLLVQGTHHQPHHLAMARGEDMQGH